MKRLFLLGVAVCLLASGCDDLKKPLSDPQTSKADERLLGLWRERSDDDATYYHVGHAGEGFPSSVLRIVAIKHGKGTVMAPEEYLAFSTVIGNKTYLNVVLDGEKKLVKRMDEKGWKAAEVDCFTFFKYQFDGDNLIVYLIDEDAKVKAIQGGKVKGVEKLKWAAQFTDTTENVVRFITKAGDSLWNTKEPGRSERVNVGKKP